MLIRNFKSVADEVAKRNLANELLQVEISNASILDERISKSKDPNAPPPVPPQYKSQSELLKDQIAITKQAIDALLEMNFEYSQASQIVQYIHDHHGGDDGVVKFLSSIPTIKADINKKFNSKLITPEFFQNYLDIFFDELGVSFGFSFGKEGGLDVGGINELSQILPRRTQIATLLTLIEQSQDVDNISVDAVDDTNDAMVQLTRLQNSVPTLDEEQKLSQSKTITAREKEQLYKAYKRVIKSAQIPAPLEIQQMSDVLSSVLNAPNPAPAKLNSVLRQIKMRTSGLTNAKLIPLKDIRKQLVGMLGIDEAVLEEYVIDDEGLEQSGFKLPSMEEEQLNDILDQIREQFAQLANDVEIKQAILQAISNINKRFGEDFIENSLNYYPQELIDIKKEVRKTFKGIPTDINDVIDKFIEVMQVVIPFQNESATRPKDAYNLADRKYYKNKVNPAVGFGMKKAIKQHFKEDERFLKATADRLKKVAKKVADDSSSDEEVMMELKKHSKREKPYEAKIEKAITPVASLGAGYIHKRIPIKKIVGKGIEVEEQPTYRTFGKYVMHIPHLTDKNVLNLKYPSLGSIPSLKPMTITNDYKDFIIDVMNTGRVNEKAFNQLHTHEQKHFERITKGAGLMDTFKLKRTGDDEEKEEVDRFNLLRGNYLGGNNSPDVVKELKGLVVKFINDGRIARNEGLNLLMELSI